MDSILVFDDFKHCFRKLDISNYNDDLVVGTVFFTRDAINVIEKYYRSVQWMTLFPRCFHAYKIIIIILRQSLMSRRLSNGTEKIWR